MKNNNYIRHAPYLINSMEYDQKTLSFAPYILGTIHHMIFIYGIHV